MMQKILLYFSFLAAVVPVLLMSANSWANKQTVTYSLNTENFNKTKLLQSNFRKIIEKAFNPWGAVIPLTFRELPPDTPADIEVAFETGDHGDEYPLSGPNFTYAAHGIYHQYVHFNYADDVNWEINIPGRPHANDTNDVYRHALFAIGGMLGLGNSRNENSVMYKEYIAPMNENGNYVEPKLSREDIEAIQGLYGIPRSNTFTIFDDIYLNGINKAFTFYDDDSCHILDDFNDKASSIDINGHCIVLYEHQFCEGKNVMIKPGCTDKSCCNPQHFGKCDFNDLATSYRSCEGSASGILIWISVIISIFIIGYLFIEIVIPWLLEGLRLLVKKLKKKHYALQAYLNQPTGNKKIAISQLKFIGIIGTGNSASVRLAHFYPDLNNTSEFLDVAVKTVKVNVSFYSIQKEIEIMEECDHENILKFVGWLQEGSHTHIVTEFMHGGSLHNFLKNDKNSPTVGQLFSYIMQILNGMIYLGKSHILHRDLAARNCLLNSTFETLKISDFGLSRKTDQNYEYVLQNDAELPFRWLPIEGFSGKDSYSIKGDVWAFGVVIFLVMWEIFERGRVPYKGKNMNEVVEFLESGKRLPQPFYCSNEIYSIMLSCWDVEPKKRPEFATLKIHLNSIINRVQPDILPDTEYKNYYETPVKICKSESE